MLSEANFLILDEPTNHLDIASKEILEHALNRYTGTLLYVSHDRYFINQTASRILELTGRTFINYIGNYDYYLEKRDELSRLNLRNETGTDTGDTKKTTDAKANWLEQKEEQARIRKRRNDLKKIEDTIALLEERNSEIDELLSKEEVYTDPEKCQELSLEKAELLKNLEEAYEKWEELAE